MFANDNYVIVQNLEPEQFDNVNGEFGRLKDNDKSIVSVFLVKHMNQFGLANGFDMIANLLVNVNSLIFMKNSVKLLAAVRFHVSFRLFAVLLNLTFF